MKSRSLQGHTPRGLWDRICSEALLAPPLLSLPPPLPVSVTALLSLEGHLPLIWGPFPNPG